MQRPAQWGTNSEKKHFKHKRIVLKRTSARKHFTNLSTQDIPSFQQYRFMTCIDQILCSRQTSQTCKHPVVQHIGTRWMITLYKSLTKFSVVFILVSTYRFKKYNVRKKNIYKSKIWTIEFDWHKNPLKSNSLIGFVEKDSKEILCWGIYMISLLHDTTVLIPKGSWDTLR